MAAGVDLNSPLVVVFFFMRQSVIRAAFSFSTYN